GGKARVAGVVGRIRKMLPQGESTLQKTTDAVHARVGELAKKAKEFYQEARRNSDAAEGDFKKYRKELEQLVEFYESTRACLQSGEKAWKEGKAGVEKCKSALQKAEKRDFGAAKRDGEEAKGQLGAARKDAQTGYDQAQEAYKDLPETVKRELQRLMETLRGNMGKGDGTVSSTWTAIDAAAAGGSEGGLAEAKKEQAEAEQLFAKGWDEEKKELDKVAEETKKKVKGSVDRVLKRLEQEVVGTEKHVIDKSLETANKSCDLSPADSASANDAQKQLKARMQQALEDCKAELRQLSAEFKAAQKAGEELVGHVGKAADAAGEMSKRADAAAAQTHDNPVEKADKHQQEAVTQQKELQKQHDAEKGKHEEQTKSALKSMKDQYGKLHEAGQKLLQGPLKQALEKSDTAIGKSEHIAMSQAPGALDH